MSQLSLSNSARVQALQRFGYSIREAEFLMLAALHGGYFVRPQYARFIDREIGGTAAALIEKLMTREHARATPLTRGTILYHLCARPFYAALGQGDNRNRREKQPLTIKNKLMALDFVLEHRTKDFLATEQDKVQYFTARGVALSTLPNKRYASTTTGQITTRYFVEKSPIYVEEYPVFAFVDEGLTTASRFVTFLSQHQLLFRELSRFHVEYVAASPLPFRWAEPAFARFLMKLNAASAASAAPNLARLADHFALRQQIESKELDGIDRDKLIRFRNDRQHLSGPRYDTLFDSWKASGDSALHAAVSPTPQPQPHIQGTFSTHLLRGNYDFFGTLTAL